jgi:prepilin peptidase CpaA
MSAAIWLTLAGCLTASYTDVRTRRIPNWLTGSLAAGALILHSFSGLRAALVSLTVMLVLTALGTLVYSRGGIGGGDVKLAVAASGTLSYPLCVPFLLYAAIGGGLLAVIFVAMRGTMRPSLSRAIALTAGGAPGVTPAKSEMLPYAVAFAFGAVVVALSQTIAPFLRITL